MIINFQIWAKTNDTVCVGNNNSHPFDASLCRQLYHVRRSKYPVGNDYIGRVRRIVCSE